MPTPNYGLSLEYISTPPSTYSAVPGVIHNIPEIAEALETVEWTNHSGNGNKEYVPTLLDVSEVTIEMEYDATNDVMRGLMLARAKTGFKVTYSDGMTAVFDAYVVGFVLNTDIADVRRVSVTLRPTGALTLTPA